MSVKNKHRFRGCSIHSIIKRSCKIWNILNNGMSAYPLDSCPQSHARIYVSEHATEMSVCDVHYCFSILYRNFTYRHCLQFRGDSFFDFICLLAVLKLHIKLLFPLIGDWTQLCKSLYCTLTEWQFVRDRWNNVCWISLIVRICLPITSLPV